MTRKCKKCREIKPISEFPVYDVKTGARRHACIACDSARVSTWHQEHKEHRLNRARVRYAADPSARWTPERRVRANELARIRNAELRRQVLEAYGSRCVCCGINEPKFLSIDHIGNDGAALRKIHGVAATFYRWLIKNNFPSGFQTLCMNCNFGKAMNKGTCPHQRKEGSTTIPQGSTAERPEVPRDLERFWRNGP